MNRKTNLYRVIRFIHISIQCCQNKNAFESLGILNCENDRTKKFQLKISFWTNIIFPKTKYLTAKILKHYWIIINKRTENWNIIEKDELAVKLFKEFCNKTAFKIEKLLIYSFTIESVINLNERLTFRRCQKYKWQEDCKRLRTRWKLEVLWGKTWLSTFERPRRSRTRTTSYSSPCGRSSSSPPRSRRSSSSWTSTRPLTWSPPPTENSNCLYGAYLSACVFWYYLFI